MPRKILMEPRVLQGTFIAVFFVASALLFFVGRHELPTSTAFTWLLAFAGTLSTGVLMLVLQRLREELRLSRLALAQRNAELTFARQVQEALFPRRFPAQFDLEFEALCIPSQGISGDYYDIQELNGNFLLIAIADISGKGIPAALLMASLQAQMRVLVKLCGDLTQVAADLNRQLHATSESAAFATLFLACWDQRKSLLTYVNAGHPPPLVFTSDRVHNLSQGGLPIGLFPESRYDRGEICLHPGDLLVLYSDGITEAVSRNGDEFGEDRLAQTVRAARGLPLEEIRKKVIGAIQDWTQIEAQDDVTLVLVRGKKENGGVT